MKKLVTVVIILIFGLGDLFSQDRKFSLGVELVPGISMNFNDIASVTNRFKQSTSIGARVQYELNNRLILKSGIFYTNKGHRSSLSSFQWGTQHNGNGGFNPNIPSGEPDNLEYTYTYNYLEVPLACLISFKKTEEINFYVQPGFSALFNFRNTYFVKESDLNGNLLEEKKETFAPHDTPNLNLFFAIGYQTLVHNKFIIFLEPRLDYSLLGKNIAFGNHYYTFNIATGMMF